VRVFLIDDHALFRAGLESLLERHGIVVVGHSRDGRENLADIATLAADIILLDMRLGDTDGLTVLEDLRLAGDKTPVVVLTTSRDDNDLINSLRKGARGYLLKDMEPSQLVDALHRVLRGETAIAPEMAATLARVIQGKPADEVSSSPFAPLTPRERQILTHLAEGQSNKVIASQLGISDGTVKLHVKAVLRKLGVHSRVEAAILAVENGFTHSPAKPSA